MKKLLLTIAISVIYFVLVVISSPAIRHYLFISGLSIGVVFVIMIVRRSDI